MIQAANRTIIIAIAAPLALIEALAAIPTAQLAYITYSLQMVTWGSVFPLDSWAALIVIMLLPVSLLVGAAMAVRTIYFPTWRRLLIASILPVVAGWGWITAGHILQLLPN